MLSKTDSLPSTNNSFNFQKWLACKFSLKYPCITLKTGNENIQTYQVQLFILI